MLQLSELMMTSTLGFNLQQFTTSTAIIVRTHWWWHPCPEQILPILMMIQDVDYVSVRIRDSISSLLRRNYECCLLMINVCEQLHFRYVSTDHATHTHTTSFKPSFIWKVFVIYVLFEHWMVKCKLSVILLYEHRFLFTLLKYYE